jgi:HlyD family secretion protein
MIQSRLLSRTVLLLLIVAPMGVIGVLASNAIWSSLKNPESKLYSSRLGYPALQRLSGSPIKVQTIQVQARSIASGISAPGEAVALQQVDIRPVVTGAVEQVFVVEGEKVAKGQPLLQIQKAPFEDVVIAAQNDLEVARTNFQSLQLSGPTKLKELRANMENAKDRFMSAQNRLKEIDGLAESEFTNNVEAAKTRLETAEKKLAQLEFLAKEGVVSKFQLYDMQDTYAIRQRELLAAEQGALSTQSQLFGNQDFQITRKDEMMATQLEFTRVRQELEKQILAAHLNVLNKSIELQQATRNLQRTTISAPSDGLVSQINIRSGEVADSSSREPVITLTQNIVFRAYLDQAQLNTVKIGDISTVRLVAYPGRTYRGKVVRLNPTVETEDSKNKGRSNRQYTYSAWVKVDGLQMTPGLQGFVEFDRGNKYLMIPESAVTHLSAGEGMVMVIKSGKATLKKVKLGRIFDNQREVLKGLTSDEHVVISPRALNPGDNLEN